MGVPTKLIEQTTEKKPNDCDEVVMVGMQGEEMSVKEAGDDTTVEEPGQTETAAPTGIVTVKPTNYIALHVNPFPFWRPMIYGSIQLLCTLALSMEYLPHFTSISWGDYLGRRVCVCLILNLLMYTFCGIFSILSGFLSGRRAATPTIAVATLLNWGVVGSTCLAASMIIGMHIVSGWICEAKRLKDLPVVSDPSTILTTNSPLIDGTMILINGTMSNDDLIKGTNLIVDLFNRFLSGDVILANGTVMVNATTSLVSTTTTLPPPVVAPVCGYSWHWLDSILVFANLVFALTATSMVFDGLHHTLTFMDLRRLVFNRRVAQVRREANANLLKNKEESLKSIESPIYTKNKEARLKENLNLLKAGTKDYELVDKSTSGVVIRLDRASRTCIIISSPAYTRRNSLA